MLFLGERGKDKDPLLFKAPSFEFDISELVGFKGGAGFLGLILKLSYILLFIKVWVSASLWRIVFM